MKDKLGREINKGARVVYTERERGKLKVGRCMNLTKKMVKILVSEETKEKTYRSPDDVLVIHPLENAVCLEEEQKEQKEPEILINNIGISSK